VTASSPAGRQALPWRHEIAATATLRGFEFPEALHDLMEHDSSVRADADDNAIGAQLWQRWNLSNGGAP